MIFGPKCTCIVRAGGMAIATILITPRNPLILNTKAATIIMSGWIRVEISLYIGHAHKTARSHVKAGEYKPPLRCPSVVRLGL